MQLEIDINEGKRRRRCAQRPRAAPRTRRRHGRRATGPHFCFPTPPLLLLLPPLPLLQASACWTRRR